MYIRRCKSCFRCTAILGKRKTSALSDAKHYAAVMDEEEEEARLHRWSPVRCVASTVDATVINSIHGFGH